MFFFFFFQAIFLSFTKHISFFFFLDWLVDQTWKKKKNLTKQKNERERWLKTWIKDTNFFFSFICFDSSFADRWYHHNFKLQLIVKKLYSITTTIMWSYRKSDKSSISISVIDSIATVLRVGKGKVSISINKRNIFINNNNNNIQQHL